MSQQWKTIRDQTFTETSDALYCHKFNTFLIWLREQMLLYVFSAMRSSNNKNRKLANICYCSCFNCTNLLLYLLCCLKMFLHDKKYVCPSMRKSRQHLSSSIESWQAEFFLVECNISEGKWKLWLLVCAILATLFF